MWKKMYDIKKNYIIINYNYILNIQGAPGDLQIVI